MAQLKKRIALSAISTLLTTATFLTYSSPAYSASGVGKVVTSGELQSSQKSINNLIHRTLGSPNPDLAGLDKALTKLGVINFRLSIPKYGLEGATLKESAEKFAAVRPDVVANPMSVPTDAFSVYMSIYGYNAGANGIYDHVEMHWDFRDNYVNGSAPDDGVAIKLGSYNFDCYANIYEYHQATDWQFVSHGDPVYISELTSDSAIWHVRDTTSGFAMLTDNGFVSLSMLRANKPGCLRSRVPVSGFYEHNQDGGGSWSGGVNLGVFFISYNGSAGSTLQKSVKELSFIEPW